MKLSVRYYLALGLALLCLLLSACSGTSAGAPQISSFTASPANIPAAGQPVTLSWVVSGSVTRLEIDQNIGSVSGTQTVVNPTGPTTYTLTASNSQGSDTATAEVALGNAAPGNRAPVAAFTNEQVSADSTAVRIKFSALDTTDPDGDTLTYTWDFGDGNGATSRDFTKRYTLDDTYTVTLTVDDGRGGTDTASKDIPIDVPGGGQPAPVPVAPVINGFTAEPGTIEAGDDATLSWDIDGSVTSLSIDQGIGSVTGTGSEKVSPDETTTYTLTATNGAGSDSAKVTLTVTPPDDGGEDPDPDPEPTPTPPNPTPPAPTPSDPVARFSYAPETVTAGNVVRLDASASSDPDGGGITAYAWLITGPRGITTAYIGETPQFTASYEGAYTVDLVVTDDELALSDPATKTITAVAADDDGGDDDGDDDGGDDGDEDDDGGNDGEG